MGLYQVGKGPQPQNNKCEGTELRNSSHTTSRAQGLRRRDVAGGLQMTLSPWWEPRALSVVWNSAVKCLYLFSQIHWSITDKKNCTFQVYSMMIRYALWDGYRNQANIAVISVVNHCECLGRTLNIPWQISSVQYVLLTIVTVPYIRAPEFVPRNWHFVPFSHHLSTASAPSSRNPPFYFLLLWVRLF